MKNANVFLYFSIQQPIFSKNVNSQSKFHSRKAVEISMRNQWKLVWEKEEKK
jgi:hypothetical protein